MTTIIPSGPMPSFQAPGAEPAADKSEARQTDAPAPAPPPAQAAGASVARGRLLNTQLVGQIQRSGSDRKKSSGRDPISRMATEALTSRDKGARERASAMIEPKVPIGPNSLTLAQELSAFPDFERPGF